MTFGFLFYFQSDVKFRNVQFIRSIKDLRAKPVSNRVISKRTKPPTLDLTSPQCMGYVKARDKDASAMVSLKQQISGEISARRHLFPDPQGLKKEEKAEEKKEVEKCEKK